MAKYQIRVYGTGFLVHAKQISATKAKFWNSKKYSDLTTYLLQGDEEFEEYVVPKNAKLTGLYAENEKNLEVNWSDDNDFSHVKFQQIYGPNINAIERIELYNLDGNTLIFSKAKPKIKNRLLTDDPDSDELNIYLEISENNLLIFETEKGYWLYESEFDEKIKSLSDLELITTNCSFGDDIDPILDGICMAFVSYNNIFKLIDAETDTLRTSATVYID